jgi:redoxin
MEQFLSAMVGLTGAIAVAAFCLAMVAIRRLRLLQEQITLMGTVDDLPLPGDPVPEFVAEATDGGLVSNSDLAGPDVLVLFLTGSCPTCFDAVSMLRELPATARPRPIAVVIGQPADVAGLVADLEPLARVVVETAHNGLPARFAVRGFPAALVVGDGVVRAATHFIDQIELGVRA